MEEQQERSEKLAETFRQPHLRASIEFALSLRALLFQFTLKNLDATTVENVRPSHYGAPFKFWFQKSLIRDRTTSVLFSMPLNFLISRKRSADSPCRRQFILTSFSSFCTISTSETESMYNAYKLSSEFFMGITLKSESWIIHKLW